MDPDTYDIKIKSQPRRLKGDARGEEANSNTDWDVQMGIYKRYLTENAEG